jgi:hypothetical protein
MAKSDLLKEAIADANAVRETALANAKIALEEAFTPRIQSMLSAKLSEELEDEDEEGMEGADRMGAEMYEQEDEMDMEEPMEEPEMGEMEPEAGEEIGVAVDVDGDGEYDYEGELGAEEGEMEDMEMGDEMEDEGDLDLESIIRELEEDLNEEEEEEAGEEGMMGAERMMKEEEEEPEAMEEDIDSIIEAILGEEEEEEIEEQVADEAGDDGNGMLPEAAELEEAYATINQLRGVLQEVNLLNAKLLYTNKLFRNFELSENQKMKVIENFDRAGNTREVKLVFSTLAESFQKPAKKRVVKEHKNVASKAVGTTAPAKEIISEGNEMAARFKKLAGLL